MLLLGFKMFKKSQHNNIFHYSTHTLTDIFPGLNFKQSGNIEHVMVTNLPADCMQQHVGIASAYLL